MVTLRCTRRLLTRLKATPSSAAPASTARLGGWYADLVPARSPLVLAINERTLASVVVPLAPAKTVVERWVDSTGLLLHRAQRIATKMKHRRDAADVSERLAIARALELRGYLRQTIGGWC
jgi:hypothetical protein